MARVLDSFEFPRGQLGLYCQFIDGQIWELTKGVDFHTSVKTCIGGIDQTARRAGMRIQSKVSDDGNTITVRAYVKEKSEATDGDDRKD